MLAGALLLAASVPVGAELGDRLLREYTVYENQPIIDDDAYGAGFTPSGACIPKLGNPFAKDGASSESAPVTLYFTGGGQISGVGVDVFGAMKPELVDAGYFIPVDKGNKLNATERYHIAVGFRGAADVCSDQIYPEKIGTSAIINPHGIAKEIPLTSKEAEEAKFHRGSCFNGYAHVGRVRGTMAPSKPARARTVARMGFHYFLDLVRGPRMSWQAKNLMPVVPMYDPTTNSLNAIFFASTVNQNSLFSSHGWEPVPLINFAMVCVPLPRASELRLRFCTYGLQCKNWCDSDCTFSDTSIWSTMHFYFNDVKELKCPSNLKCSVPGISCCPISLVEAASLD